MLEMIRPQLCRPGPTPHWPAKSEASRGTRREKKQTRWRKQGYREASPAKSQEDAFETDASEANAGQAGEAQKEAQQEAQ